MGEAREQDISLNAVLYPLEYAFMSGWAGGVLVLVVSMEDSSVTDENSWVDDWHCRETVVANDVL